MVPPRPNPRAGFTLIELVIVIVLLGALTATAVPIFTNLQEEAVLASEEAVIGSVRSAISLHYAETAVGGEPSYPVALDEAPAGSAASDANGFFARVLADPITDSWTKDSGGRYVGPSGGVYAYDAERGRLVRKN